MGISLALSIPTGAAIGSITLAAAGAGLTHPFLPEHSSALTAAGVGISYAIHYGTLVFNGKTNKDLLDDESVNTSPNIFATGLYFIMKKFVPDHPKFQTVGVMAGTLGPAAFTESGYLTTLFTAASGPSSVVARNLTGAVLNIAQGNVNKLWLRRAREREQEAQKDI